ncbi:TetR/AcrR family transcriptional regulator [Streptomyces sp. TRM66268-LWL]|uniref:TetR/AcrR family transcriptional regulator n=1 Tax=Streptomyces polyasparticus TaxID=2767826 RepID=A0ABR7S6W8_9ACTN|nr:TetR/AcrR family transcriptional regulator [Streptomyces polyasparticus]MBC9711225.1 TetR/AcrR family transcriptional regulator [Streptomyces polyasparticus]
MVEKHPDRHPDEQPDKQPEPHPEPRTKPRGRPRSFDRATALEKALQIFWERGYEATSVSDLTRAMGIGPPSMYAAFGDKRSLFAEVLVEYGRTHGAVPGRALEAEPTARAGIERMLREVATAFTEPGHPHGCLVIHAATNCTTPEVEETLRAQRNANVADFERRIRDDIAAGELPPDADARVLALHVAAVFQGMSQQARDGASAEDLEQVARLAMRAWPPAPVGIRTESVAG